MWRGYGFLQQYNCSSWKGFQGCQNEYSITIVVLSYRKPQRLNKMYNHFVLKYIYFYEQHNMGLCYKNTCISWFTDSKRFLEFENRERKSPTPSFLGRVCYLIIRSLYFEENCKTERRILLYL